MVNRLWPTAVAGKAGKADNVSSVSASACHIGVPIDVNPGELMLVYGRSVWLLLTCRAFLCTTDCRTLTQSSMRGPVSAMRW